MAVTERELFEGIAKCLIGEPTPAKMLELASYYIVKEHLFGEEKPIHTYSTAPAPQEPKPEPIDTIGNSDFLMAVRGKDSGEVVKVFDELMEALELIQPKIYNEVMRRISGIK